MAEIKQLFTPQADSSSQAADLIHISRTFPPDLKAAFADKIEHFSEYEFGYYAELSSTKNVIEFKNKILSIVQGLGFSDFAFMRVHCGDIDSRLLLTTPADLLASYFGDDFMKYDMMLPYAEQKLDPVYCSEVFAYAADSPFQNETTRAMKAIFELNKSYGFHDFYNIPMKARNGEGNVLFSVTVRGHSPTDVKRIVDECHMALTLLCEAIDDRLNHTRVCESRMELTPVIQLIEIAKEGVSGNYKDLKKLFDDQYSRSVMLLPHVMRQRILPVIRVEDESVVNAVGVLRDTTIAR